MSWGYYRWRPYVPVGERRAKAAREVAKLAKKTGRPASPVALNGRTIASTFWGRAWCDNLEAYSDFENRLPRGRTYVRNGSVVDLQIARGKVTALVSGSELYRIAVNIKPLARSRWKSLQLECAGKIDSLIELLQGKLSSAVMRMVTRPEGGLFPAPKEIELDCSCPDWADLCKHVAATLYGVGARLDQNPGLLFLLRGVDPSDLISKASAAEAVRQATTRAEGAPAMTEAEAADVFGIELAPRAATPPPREASAPATEAGPAADLAAPMPMTPAASAHRRQPRTRRRPTAAARARLVALAKARWQRMRQTAAPAARARPDARRAHQISRRLSAAARARIAATARARWARLRTQGPPGTRPIQTKARFPSRAASGPTS